MPSIGATATSGGPGISHWDIPPMFAATRVACFVSLPRRYSTCTVSSGSSLRASSTSFLPGPDSSSSSGFTAASEVPLNFEDEDRSEEHTSELQSRPHLVCRLLLEKKKSRPVQSADASETKDFRSNSSCVCEPFV